MVLVALLRLLATRPPSLLAGRESVVCAVAEAKSTDLAAAPPS